jgi:NAD(P)H dehydrogenase (quinone)
VNGLQPGRGTPLALTGSTGRVGGLVAARLASAGTSVRLLVRSPERAPQIPGAVVVQSVYGDGERSVEALRGTRVLLMVSAAESATRLDEHRAFVDAAAAAGVEQVVYTSFVGASPRSTFTLGRDHAHTEEHIRASGMSFTFLRDSLYANFLPRMVGEDGALRGPAGDGRLAAVAQEDVAEVAATVLLRPEAHGDATYELTGPSAFTLAEAAAMMTRLTGREIRYVDESLEEAYASRASYGAPKWQVDAWVSTYTAIAAGELEKVSDDVRMLVGRPALSLEDVLTASS